MRIAQVAPLCESVPPRFYGGTERVVAYLTDALVDDGDEVTLFASGDSVTKAHLIPPCHHALRLNKNCIDPLAYHILMLETVFKEARSFDLIHFHIDYMQFPLLRREPVRSLTTLHGCLTIPDLVPLYREFAEIPVVSISDSQRDPLPWINWQGTVYHGLPEDLYHFQEKPSDYLAFLGRISPEKGLDRAIDIAERVGMPLKIAAKIDKADKDYFTAVIQPRLNSSVVEFIGEIGNDEKDAFLGNAFALLFPIDWAEPFGLVMIEAMACGTPVIAFRRGSVPEIMVDGVTGFIVDDVDTAAAAVSRIALLSRLRCRKIFEARFTVTRMVQEYRKLYARLIH